MKRASIVKGFSLIEVTLAIGVAAVCLVAIFALLPVGLQSTQSATQQMKATDILGAVIADLRATPPTVPRGTAARSIQFAIEIPENPVSTQILATLFFDGNGQASSSLTSQSVYRLIVTFVPNGPGTRVATQADLKVTWPAAADPTVSRGSLEMFVGLNRN